MSHKKTLQELTIKDNFMFGAVMVDEKLCKEFLELVLGFQIRSIRVSKEKSMVYHPEYKGVRLDIMADDENQTHYNVEMQVKYKRDLGKRSRYYHSQMDMELLFSGADYEVLPDSYVIFICNFDPFGRKRYCYTFRNKCQEDDTVELGDGSHTIFLSTYGENEEEVPERLVQFLKYVRADTDEMETEDHFVKRVQEAVRKIKASREMEERYMLLEELIREEREEAKEEGRAEEKINSRANMTISFLEELGEVPDDLREIILNERSLETLTEYTKEAARAKSIKEFEEKIRKTRKIRE